MLGPLGPAGGPRLIGRSRKNRDATPGRQHRSIADALKASDADGTRSILDIAKIGDAPDYCEAAPFAPGELESLVGSARPSAEQIDASLRELLREVERGMARYVIAYEDERPTKVMSLGYSFD